MGKNKNKSKKSNTSNVEIQEIVETPKNLVSSKSEPIISKPIVVESSIQEIIDESATNIDVTETNSKKNKKKADEKHLLPCFQDQPVSKLIEDAENEVKYLSCLPCFQHCDLYLLRTKKRKKR